MKKNGAQKSAATLALASLVAGTFSIATDEAKAIDSPTTQVLGTGASLRTNLLRSNQFAAQPANNLYADNKAGEGKCGEGKCGEGKCGEKKVAADKAGEGKCGEGKCGEKKQAAASASATATPAADSKSGEGTCGEKKK